MAASGVKDIEAKLPTKDEARRIAVNIAKLPELLGQDLMRGPPYWATVNTTMQQAACGGPFR